MMFTTKTFLGAILVICSLLALLQCEEKLLMSHVIFRHGQRNPYAIYPKSTVKNWVGGLGTLQKKGETQMYNLGKALKSQYIDKQKFVSGDYNFDEIYVKSSNSERCLMSAEAFLAGMFPPKNENLFENTILWKPLPVQTVFQTNDTLRILKMDCPLRDKYLNEVYTSEAWTDYINKNKDFLDRVYENTGYEADLKKVLDVYDESLVETLSAIQLPNWITNDEYNRLADAAKFIISQTYSSKDEKIQKILAGHLLYTIAQHMVRFLPDDAKKDIPDYLTQNREFDEKHDKRKLYIYSTHDVTIYALLSSLGVPLDKILPFAASLTLELQEVTENNSKTLVFKVFSSEDTKNFVKVPLPACNQGNECTLVEFLKVYEKLFQPDVNEMCNADVDPSTTVQPGRYGTSWTKKQYIAYVFAACYGAFSTVLFIILILYLVFGIKRY